MGARIYGHARWKKDWVKVSCELTQDWRAWSASIRDVIFSLGDAGSTRPRMNADANTSKYKISVGQPQRLTG